MNILCRIAKEALLNFITKWFYPKFSIHSSNYYKLTTVRIVFNASATCEGKSLNTESLPGPKLQSDIADILVKFRKEPVALVGDISQMYHQLVLLPDDRPLRRFLWSNFDQSKETEVYEFIFFVLGDVTVRFVVSLHGNNMQSSIKQSCHWQLKLLRWLDTVF